MKEIFTALFIVLFVTSGCASPKAANEMASVTAANVSVVSSSLTRFAEDANILAQDRARALQNLSNQLDRSDRQLTEDLIILKRIGALKPYNELDTLIGQSRAIHSADNREISDALITEIMDNYESLQTPSATLSKLAETLTTLGAHKASRDRVEFIALFAKQVKKDIDDAIEQHETSNSQARRRIDEANVDHHLTLSPATDNN